MNRRRVVVTGLSTVTPIGNDVATSWANLKAGVSGIAPITHFDASEHATKFAGEIKDFDATRWIEPKQLKRWDRFCVYGVSASLMALEDSGLAVTDDNARRIGCIMGCGLGGMETIEVFSKKLFMGGGPKRISPFYIPLLIANMAPGLISIYTGVKGTNMVVTSACTSGLHGIGYSALEIMCGRADAMIAGGVEATISEMGISGFNALKALSTRNDSPETASRPFDKDRDGFVMGEGAGVMILEEYEHAKARGARIYAEVVGFGCSADAHHMTAPPENGEGMALSMQNAIEDAGLKPQDIEHINAHATSTPLSDVCETRAIKTLFGDHAKNVAITANKSMMGHLLGAAGGAEGVFSVMTLYDKHIPGTINYFTPDPECDLDYVTDGTRAKELEYVLCNSFGFGGTNGSVIFKRAG